jgi:cell division protein FtsZ
MTEQWHTTEAEAMPHEPLKVLVLGIGGGGCNAAQRLDMSGFEQVQVHGLNTDVQALKTCRLEHKHLLGKTITRGLSCGADRTLGERVAEADRDWLSELVKGAQVVFLLAGLGGGTSSGVAPVVARLAKGAGALVFAFVTKPFAIEGEKRLLQADHAVVELREHCGAVVPLPNDLLLQHMDETATVLDAFEQADAWICRGVVSICTMLFKTGVINLDYAALKGLFDIQAGKSLYGLGRGEGEGAVQEALTDLELCPLVHTPDFARKVDRLLINIVSGPELGMAAVSNMLKAVAQRYGRGSNTIFGAILDEAYRGRVELCILGTNDMGAEPFLKRVQQGTPGEAQAPEKALDQAPPMEGQVSGPGVHASKLSGKSKRGAQDLQEEFLFIEADQQRGYFDKTSRNIFEGQDLDVPTYLRRGIRISI